MRKIIVLIMILTLFLPYYKGKADRMVFAKMPANYTWTLEEDKEGIKVYTRSKQGTSLKEFKGVVTVEASLGQVVAILKDNTISQQWMYRTSSGKLLKQMSDWEWETYFQNEFPFPMGKRDLALHFKMSQGADKKISMVMTSIADEVKPESGYTRMKIAYGEIDLTPLGNGQVEVMYQFFADPAGYVPAFLINSLITDTPYNTLLNLRELLKTNIHKGAKLSYIKE